MISYKGQLIDVFSKEVLLSSVDWCV